MKLWTVAGLVPFVVHQRLHVCQAVFNLLSILKSISPSSKTPLNPSMMITEAMKFLAMPNLEDAKIHLCRACHDLVRLLVLAGLRLIQEGSRLFGGLRFQL